VTPLYPQKLALTSPTGGGRSVGIVRSRTKATEFRSLRPLYLYFPDTPHINKQPELMSHLYTFTLESSVTVVCCCCVHEVVVHFHQQSFKCAGKLFSLCSQSGKYKLLK